MFIFFVKDSDDDDSFHHIDIKILLVEHEGAVLSPSLHLSSAWMKILIEADVLMGYIRYHVYSVWTSIRTLSQLP